MKIRIQLIIFIFTCLKMLCGYFAYSQAYFQQEVNYKIQVKLDDQHHYLYAHEEVTYINHSEDSLTFLYFHLWPNAYSGNNTALAKQLGAPFYSVDFNKNDRKRGFIDSLNFKVSGMSAHWIIDSVHPDICKVFLHEPLQSGDSIIISTPFRVKIPSGDISRLGHIGQSYQISQWYPKPAVYDKYGWHPMPYLDMGEFFSEFGTFEVSIMLPENYLVGATGCLQNPDEKMKLKEIADETLGIEVYPKDLSFPESSALFKTITFKAENVHDFAWFADKRFHMMQDSVFLSNSKRYVQTQVLFTNKHADLWKNAIQYVNDAILSYSSWYGDYPYDFCTAVQAPLAAGGGMEYPMITVINDFYTPLSLETVIAHEVGHNWFYGILANNERDFPWMDEGINSFSEDRYINNKYPENKLYPLLFDNLEKLAQLLNIDHLAYNDYHALFYLFNARINADQPLHLSSTAYTEINYGTIVYGKGARIMHHLHDAMGEERFNKIMQEYFENWKFKHPYPEDFFKIVSKHHHLQPTDWFVKDLYTTTKKLDYAMGRSKPNQILIRNKGQIKAPFSIGLIKEGKLIRKYQFQGIGKKEWVTIPGLLDADIVVIDPENKTPDIQRKNNQARTHGILKRIEPLKLNLLGIIENPENTEINILPMAGWNYSNKQMFGLMLYSTLFPQSKLEYQIAPMFAFGNKTMAGIANLKYHLIPYRFIFSKISLGVSVKRFGFKPKESNSYHRIAVDAIFTFKKNDETSPFDQSISLQCVNVSQIEQILESNTENNGSTINHRYFYRVGYQLKHHHIRYPVSFNLQLTGSGQLFLVSNTAINGKFRFTPNKYIHIRLFAGKFIFNKTNPTQSLYDLTLNSTHGFNDYLFEGYYFDRFNSNIHQDFYARQIGKNQGGFALFSENSHSNNWLFSINTCSSLPLPQFIPLKVYGNIGWVGNDYLFSVLGMENFDHFYYEFGFKAFLLGDFMEVYFPLFFSKELHLETPDKFSDYIRFSLNLNFSGLYDNFSEMFSEQ